MTLKIVKLDKQCRIAATCKQQLFNPTCFAEEYAVNTLQILSHRRIVAGLSLLCCYLHGKYSNK